MLRAAWTRYVFRRERGRATGRSGADTVAWYSPGLDLSSAEIALIELATRTIDGTSDATTGEEGINAMGAAVRTADGRVFVGVNLFHFTGGPRSVLASELLPGAYRIDRL